MTRKYHYVSLSATAAGIVLLGYLFRRAGVNTVVQAIRLLGVGFVAVLILSGVRQCLRAIAWRCCIDSGAHPQRLFDLVTLRLIGESATDLSFAGPFLGETVKIWAVSKSISARFGVTSVVIEDLIYCAGTAAFVLTGFLILLFSTARTHHLIKSSGAIILLALATTILAIVVERGDLLRRLFLQIRDWPRVKALFVQHGQAVHGWETGIWQFFRTREKPLVAVLSIEIVVNLISFGETYLILRSATAHASLLNAYLVESANRCAQLVASFVPFGLGIDEGTTTATLHSLGRTLSEGVSVAAIRKIRSLFWDFVGLGLAARFMIARRAKARRISLAAERKEDVAQSLEIAAAERIP